MIDFRFIKEMWQVILLIGLIMGVATFVVIINQADAFERDKFCILNGNIVDDGFCFKQNEDGTYTKIYIITINGNLVEVES